MVTFGLGLQCHIIQVGVPEEESVPSAAILHKYDTKRVNIHGWPKTPLLSRNKEGKL